MSVYEIFNQRFNLWNCPHCGKIKKHGQWLELTTRESQKLSQTYHGFDIIEESCPTCKTKNAIGYA
jgi:rubrerythrin